MSTSAKLDLRNNSSATQERITHQGAQGVLAPTAALDPSLPDSSSDKLVSPETATSRKPHRARRACDECRGRKIRCDGRHPCLHCSALNLGEPWHILEVPSVIGHLMIGPRLQLRSTGQTIYATFTARGRRSCV
jgi:hypothetical protein